jgi:uncharacterized protein involved in type VI secretion and phage assembly
MACGCECGGRSRPGLYGLYPAIVTRLTDPEGLGRVEVRFPWLGEEGDTVRAWATLLSPYAEDAQGLQALPSVDTQVVVGFEAGDLRRPYIVGAAWNGREAMPEAPDEANDIRVLRTRSGSLLEFDDTEGAARITLTTRSGHEVVLDEGGAEIRVSHPSGHSITLDPAGRVEITATATVEVNAAAVNVHAPTAIFDGIVQCTTLVASAGVVSPSYTPGAGNIW